MDWRDYALNKMVLLPEDRILIAEGPKNLKQAWKMSALRRKILRAMENRIPDPWD